jgi:hypothetical protein
MNFPSRSTYYVHKMYATMTTPQSLPELLAQVLRHESLLAVPAPMPTQSIEGYAVEPMTAALTNVLTTESILPGKPDLAVTDAVAYHLLVACSAFPTDPVAAWNSLFYNVVHNVLLRDEVADPSSTAVVVDMAAIFGSEPGALREVTLTPESDPVSVYDVAADPASGVMSALSALEGDGGIGAGGLPYLGYGWLQLPNSNEMVSQILSQMNSGALAKLGVNRQLGVFTLETMVDRAVFRVVTLSKIKYAVYFNVNQARTVDIPMTVMLSTPVPNISFSKTPFARPKLTRGMKHFNMSADTTEQARVFIEKYVSYFSGPNMGGTIRTSLGLTAMGGIVGIHTVSSATYYNNGSKEYTYFLNCVVSGPPLVIIYVRVINLFSLPVTIDTVVVRQ